MTILLDFYNSCFLSHVEKKLSKLVDNHFMRVQGWSKGGLYFCRVRGNRTFLEIVSWYKSLLDCDRFRSIKPTKRICCPNEAQESYSEESHEKFDYSKDIFVKIY